MALTQISFPAEEATDWTDFIDMVKDWIVGHIRCSLTNYDADTAPQLAAGSTVELNGSYHYAGSNEPITGTPSSGNINYIYLDESAYTLSWSTTAPTWSDAKQGFYNGNDRAIGGCYYDGTNYPLKWVYINHHAGPQTRYQSVSLCGYSSSAQIKPRGQDLAFQGTVGAAQFAALPVLLPDGALVTSLKTVCAAWVEGTVSVDLNRVSSTETETAMAETTIDAAETNEDTSISTPIIDNTAYTYYIKANVDVAASMEIHNIIITYTTTRR